MLNSMIVVDTRVRKITIHTRFSIPSDVDDGDVLVGDGADEDDHGDGEDGDSAAAADNDEDDGDEDDDVHEEKK